MSLRLAQERLVGPLQKVHSMSMLSRVIASAIPGTSSKLPSLASSAFRSIASSSVDVPVRLRSSPW